MAEGEKRLSKPPPDLLMPVLGLDNSIRGKILLQEREMELLPLFLSLI
jgi:hypothetical protein